MCQPWYRDFKAEEVPQFTQHDGVRVSVIAGESHGTQGAVTRPTTTPIYLDVHLPKGTSFSQALDAGMNAFVYVYRGSVQINGQEVGVQRMGLLANTPESDGVVISATEDAKVLLIGGQPLNEPIVQYGPFVMNTQEEIYQALSDMREGRLGERA